MGTDTTGSLVTGLVDGMGAGYSASGTIFSKEVTFLTGDPSDKLTVNVGSQLAYSTSTQAVFMGLAQNGSTWVYLGSVAAY